VAIQQDFLEYHKSIGRELKIAENRIRNLIGSSHWLTDGEHKESILRKVLSNFLPEIYKIGTGFVCYPNLEGGGDNSSQIDILITSKVYPTLYKSDELYFVTPECVSAIIEVKTTLTNGENIQGVLQKLSNDVKKIRENKDESDKECWAGLFIYNEKKLGEEEVLKALQEVSNNDINGVINCVSVGEHMFFRFWEEGHPESGLEPCPIWHSYKLRNLSQAYFISNVVAFFSPIFTKMTSDAFFPIRNTKEVSKQFYIRLNEVDIHRF